MIEIKEVVLDIAVVAPIITGPGTGSVISTTLTAYADA
jgi:hypothetical protein